MIVISSLAEERHFESALSWVDRRDWVAEQGEARRVYAQMLIEQVRETQASLAPPSVTVWRELDTLVVSLEDDCRRLHARYMRLREALAALAQRRSVQAHAPNNRAPARRAG